MTFHKVLGLSASLKVLIVFFPFWPLLLNWTTFSLPWLWLIYALSFTPLINSKHLYDHCSDMHSSYALVCVLLEGRKCFCSFIHSFSKYFMSDYHLPTSMPNPDKQQTNGMPSAPTSLTFWRGGGPWSQGTVKHANGEQVVDERSQELWRPWRVWMGAPPSRKEWDGDH